MLQPFIDGRKMSVELQCDLVNSENDINIVDTLAKTYLMIDRLTLALSTAEKTIELLSKKLEINPESFYSLINKDDSEYVKKS